MSNEEITEVIQQEISHIAFTSVGVDDALLDQNILDSVGTVDLAVALEGAFDIQIPFVDINRQHFHSVAALVAYVKLKRG
jgi:acyl carrier protein